jgi:hypothetical protein
MDIFLRMYELDYWNGSVLNVAHGMIAICTECMDVLLMLPVIGP